MSRRRRFLCRFIAPLSLALVLGACAPTPTLTLVPTLAPIPEAVSYIAITQALQADAPVIWITNDGLTAAWVGADAAGVHQDARQINGLTANPVVVLPLPPDHPYAQQGYPAGNGNLHLLWLDTANASNDDSNRLYSAVLTPDLTVRRGPIAISNALTLRYDAISDGAGGLWTVWSGGILAEPAIYAQQIDDDGRPRTAVRIASNGDWPALARTRRGDVLVFWIDGLTGQLMRGHVTIDGVTDVVALANGVALASGDRLENTSAAIDSDSAYYVWNVTRANGERESWLSSGRLNEMTWAAPTQLALPNGNPRWVATPHDPTDILPVVADVNSTLSVVFLWGGQIVGVQPVAPLDAPGLVGPPRILVANDDERMNELIVAWSQPTASGPADLRLATIPWPRER